jgi:hypothetical protein
VSHPANSTLTVAWATHSRIKAFPSSSPTTEERARRTVFLVGVISAIAPFC